MDLNGFTDPDRDICLKPQLSPPLLHGHNMFRLVHNLQDSQKFL